MGFSSVSCAPGTGSVSTRSGGRSGGSGVCVAAASLGVAEGSAAVSVGEGVFLLHPESKLARPIMVMMVNPKITWDGLLIILCDG